MKNLRFGRLWVGLALLAGLCLAALPAMADPVMWTVNATGIYGDSGQLTGWFFYNGTTITSWDLSMSANNGFAAEELTSANSSVVPFNLFNDEFQFATCTSNCDSVDWYSLNPYGSANGFQLDLGTAAAYSGIQWQEGYMVPSAGYAAYYGGSLVGVATPEPSTWALSAGGLLVLAGFFWMERRRRTAGEAA